jgi:transcriptional regulator with XRE-family HTH domain
MTPEEFTEALKSLNWKQSDFCRMAGVDKSTPSRWMNGATPIPLWADKFLQMARAVRALNAITVPPKK